MCHSAFGGGAVRERERGLGRVSSSQRVGGSSGDPPSPALSSPPSHPAPANGSRFIHSFQTRTCGLSPSNSTSGNAAGHRAIFAYSMQCGADRGVSASVHRGYLVCGGNIHNVQSKHGVTPGSRTRAWPLNPSVPPSTRGLMVSTRGLPSSSYSRKEHACSSFDVAVDRCRCKSYVRRERRAFSWGERRGLGWGDAHPRSPVSQRRHAPPCSCIAWPRASRGREQSRGTACKIRRASPGSCTCVPSPQRPPRAP